MKINLIINDTWMVGYIERNASAKFFFNFSVEKNHIFISNNPSINLNVGLIINKDLVRHSRKQVKFK